jgi:hypothetical protein
MTSNILEVQTVSGRPVIVVTFSRFDASTHRELFLNQLCEYVKYVRSMVDDNLVSLIVECKGATISNIDIKFIVKLTNEVPGKTDDIQFGTLTIRNANAFAKTMYNALKLVLPRRVKNELEGKLFWA